jgi:hypothetical protein
MIAGTWQALFSPGVSNPIAPGFPIYPAHSGKGPQRPIAAQMRPAGAPTTVVGT